MNLGKRAFRETGRDYALRTLKDNIVRLELEPGSMVSEKELADELGLSRGPVREALIELSKVKIVEIYPQRGSAISLIDYDLIEEASFMRETLETAVALRCCGQGLKPEYQAPLRENVELQQFYLDNENYGKFWELDNEFHHQLFLSVNFTQIYNLMNSMTIHFDRVRAMSLNVLKGVKLAEDHRLILDAIIQGDSESVKQLMHNHLTRYKIDKEAIHMKYPQYIKGTL